MAEEFIKHGNGYQMLDQHGNMIAEITYAPYGDDKVLANHTYVSPSLRGQGVAERMLDHMVAEMKAEGKKIVPSCSYVVAAFERYPDKYGDIAAEM